MGALPGQRRLRAGFAYIPGWVSLVRRARFTACGSINFGGQSEAEVALVRGAVRRVASRSSGSTVPCLRHN